jgi:polysaccharide deacetylase 2 family uncharacterized protein YibQ
MATVAFVAEDAPAISFRGSQPLALGFAAVAAALLLLVAGVTVFGEAQDGDPTAVLNLAAERSGESANMQARATDNVVPQTASEVPVTPAQNTAQPSVVLRITKPAYAGTALVADPALIEQTAAGPLPRIADDGRTPMQAYAPPVAATNKPRIALVIGGLGIGAKATAAAIEELPAAVTLAVIATAGNPQNWINEARQHGHEVLLQVPMEPYDYPDSDPGPGTLRVRAPEDANADRLTTALTRATGYAGIANLQGGRFLADSSAVAPVLTFAARRGLMFFGLPADGKSVAHDTAIQLKASYAESLGGLDADPSAPAIDQQLSSLEAQARSSGFAAASASPYPITIARIKAWAATLSGRGFVLVPASAIVGQSK